MGSSMTESNKKRCTLGIEKRIERVMLQNAFSGQERGFDAKQRFLRERGMALQWRPWAALLSKYPQGGVRTQKGSFCDSVTKCSLVSWCGASLEVP